MTAGVSLPDAPDSISGSRLFTVDGVEFTVADVVPRARAGNRELAAFPDTPAAVEESFRRSRGLLTADQLTGWLDAWGITPDEFVAWTVTPGAPDSWAALVCSGALDQTAAALAAAAASACELGAPPTSAAGFDPAGWTDRLSAAAVTDEAVAAKVLAHRLDWTVITGTGVEAPTRAAAEEIRHWAVDDGLELDIAAIQAGCSAYLLDDALESISSPRLYAVLAGALPAELVGAVPTADGWTVVHVSGRREPSVDDPGTVARAATALGHAALERAVRRHVTA